MKYLSVLLRSVFIFCTLGVCAHAAPANFHLSDDSAGPTCANFSSMGHLGWQRRGGDWADAAGQLYGGKPFDTQAIAAGGGRPFTEWNVTELVRGWLTGEFNNEGFLLRAEKDKLSGVVDFHSRESADETARPVLKLRWSDGTIDRLAPVADTYLDCSTLTSLGGRKVLKVSSGQSALLRFSLPKHRGTLTSASLLLVSDKQYGNGASVGVYRVAPAFARATAAGVSGIAQGFVRDKDISTHPDVVFATGFESPAWLTEWSEYSPRSHAEAVTNDQAGKFAPLQGHALRVRLVKGSNNGLDLRYALGGNGKAEPEEIYFRYYLRFGNDWNPYLDGGKMPGVAGTYGKAGWGMRKSDGYNGWSVRGSFDKRPSDASSVTGFTTLGSYAYHADIADSSGESWAWNDSVTGVVENNRWYAIEQYVKLNTPGETNGIFRVWVDGRQVFEKADVRFRHVPSLKIENVWFNVYHGGTSTAPKDMALYIDNVVIARKYIGPMKP